MALSLGVSAGKRIRIGGAHVLIIRDIVSSKAVRASFDGREILITDLERTELAPGVFVSCGLHNRRDDLADYTRLAFEADRSVKIERVP